MKGLKLRTIIGLFCLVLCAAGVLVAHVWKQNAYVRISMGAVKLAKQKAQLRNDIALLEVSVGGLKKISRLESMAKNRFGLEYGRTPVLVYQDRLGTGRDWEKGGKQGAENPKVPAVSKIPRAPDRGLESGKVAWRISAY
ncbi:MAG: hypothetical protein ABIW76_16025 [Fibrobacteria bacterium]